MPMQAKAEGVKLFHAKAQLWALLGFVLTAVVCQQWDHVFYGGG